MEDVYEAIVDVAEEALSRERYARARGPLEDIIEAARGQNFDAVESLIRDIDIPQVKEKLLQQLEILRDDAHSITAM